MRAETRVFTECAAPHSSANGAYKIARCGCQEEGNGISICNFHVFKRPIPKKVY